MTGLDVDDDAIDKTRTAARPATKMFCPWCGYEITDSSNQHMLRCTECGRDFYVTAALREAAPPAAVTSAEGILLWLLLVELMGIALLALPRLLANPNVAGGFGFFIGVVLNLGYWLFIASWLLLAWCDNLLRVRMAGRGRGPGMQTFIIFIPVYLCAAAAAGVVGFLVYL